MKFDFDRITDRRGTDCIKYDKLKDTFGRDDIIPMFIADMDFEIPPFISEAIAERASHKVYGYGFRGDSWYDAVAGWVERRNGWKIERDWIGFSPGVITGYVFALRALTKEGDGVVINPPVYHPFASGIKSNGRRVVDSPMIFGDGGFALDYDDLDRKLAGARALLFCNPHNPTGRVFTHEELEKVGELCCRHDVWIVSDEIHSDLIFKSHKHIHIASIRPEFAERTVTLIAPSKTFNLAGLSSAVMITPNDTARRLIKQETAKYDVGMGNIFGTAALTAAYTHGDEWVDRLNEYIDGNVEFVMRFIENNMPKIKAHRSQGTYLIWLDCRELDMSVEELRKFFVDEARIGASEGSIFGGEGAGFMRLVLAMPREIIRQAMDQLYCAYRRL